MTTGDTRTSRVVRRGSGAPTLDGMTTTPRWLREHRRALRAATGSGWRARRPVPAEDPFKRVDWETFSSPGPAGEWEAFIAAIEEAKGRPLVG